MPDVGLTTFTDPLDAEMRVVIRYSVEVNGLPVYNETYNADQIAKEIEADSDRISSIWFRRLTCVVGCRKRHGFSACLTRCLSDGECCDCGHGQC